MLEWRPFLGPFHSVLLHFPIGFLVLTFLLDLYTMRRPTAELRRVTMLATWLTTGSAVVVVTFGLWRASTGGYDEAVLAIHRAAAFSVLGLIFATAVIQRAAFREHAAMMTKVAYRSLFTCALVALVVTGHYGGTLAHGSSFLSKNAPPLLSAWLSGEPAPEGGGSGGAVWLSGQRVAADADSGAVYAEQIRPIFQAKCYGCHGPELHLSHFRIDDPKMLRQGGASGRPAIVPGEPFKSEMVRRLLLPPETRGAMPPNGDRPNADEILTIVRWVERGAKTDAH